MGKTQIEIDPAKRINEEELLAELALVDGVDDAKILREPHTLTLNGEPVQYGYLVEIDAKDEKAETDADAAIAAHDPEETSAEEREALRKAAILIDYADIIAEVKRQVLEELDGK